jgi:LysM repeat protein
MFVSRRIGLLVLALLLVALPACTRSASTPPPSTGAAGTPAGTQGASSGLQATMEAVRYALLTQTAQAAGGGSQPQSTPTPSGEGATSSASATPTGLLTTPLVSPTLQPAATTVPTARPSCPYKYVVKPGDRLFRISINLGYDPDFWMEIASANNIVSPWLIFPGQELTIPCES